MTETNEPPPHVIVEATAKTGISDHGRLIQRKTIGAAWEESLQLFLRPEGLNRYDSRGVPCVEVEDLLFDITNPRQEPRVSSLYPKELNYLIDEFTDRLIQPQAGQTSIVNDRLFRWQLPDGREFNQLDAVMAMLANDPDARYAIMGLWEPTRDLRSPTPVGPLILYPRIRAEMLNFTVVTRTLDAILGAVQLIVGFSNLHGYMANKLRVGTGPLRVLALSYHLHDMDIPRIRAMLEEK
jgi:hypothetical protein